MSAVEKAKNVAQKVVGKAEETVGKKTGDAEQVEQGKFDQQRSEERQQTEKVKDTLQD